MVDKMKNSGIEWIGEIPDNWGVKRVKDVFSIIGGCGFKDEFQGHLDGDYPFCKASDINGKDKFLDHAQNYVNQNIVDEQHYKVVPKYSILMSKIGEAMKKNHRKINTVPCIVDNNCQALCKKSNDDIIYLYYLFSQIDMIWFDNGGTIPNISNTKLLNFFIPDISMELQKHIAYHLDEKCGKIDELIANQEKQIEKLKEYKLSVITEAVTKGLDKSAPMKDSGIEWIGEIPTHWNIIRGKNVLELLGKPVLPTDEVITCFRDGEVTLRRNRREEGFTFSEKEIGYQGIDIGDLIVHGMDGFAGAIGISDSRGKASPVLIVLNSKQNIQYIMYYLRSMAYRDIFLALSTGIRVRSCDLRWNKLSVLPFLIPGIEEQNEIVAYIENKLEQIDRLIVLKQEKIEKLNEYKKSLIYEYVTGKKEV